mmetsp:Transcript_16862/g.26785  ORF Transcript_16862/g.26785 Transcript_16862/m.26785 type:complete len:251 (+) Transcript_16862:1277-2029(+)
MLLVVLLLVEGRGGLFLCLLTGCVGMARSRWSGIRFVPSLDREDLLSFTSIPAGDAVGLRMNVVASMFISFLPAWSSKPLGNPKLVVETPLLASTSCRFSKRFIIESMEFSMLLRRLVMLSFWRPKSSILFRIKREWVAAFVLRCESMRSRDNRTVHPHDRNRQLMTSFRKALLSLLGGLKDSDPSGSSLRSLRWGDEKHFFSLSFPFIGTSSLSLDDPLNFVFLANLTSGLRRFSFRTTLTRWLRWGDE